MLKLNEFRTDSPLTEEQQTAIDDTIRLSARQSSIGRKIVPYKFGPLGYGKRVVRHYTLTEDSAADVSVTEVHPTEDIIDLTQQNAALLEIAKAYLISRLDLEASKTDGVPLDTSTVASATYKIAIKENAIILDGWKPDGTNYDVNGLYQAANNDYSTTADFATSGKPIAAVLGAIDLLLADSINPPFHMVLNQTQWTEAQDVLSSTGISEMDVVRRFLGGSASQTPGLGPDWWSPDMTAATGMLCSAYPGHFDIAWGFDLMHEEEILSLKENKALYGRISETMRPRIWETNAICKMSSI